MFNIELYDIPDFTGYKADKDGNIYSFIPKGCRNRFDKSKWLKEPKKLTYRKTRTGYCRVYMRRDSTNKREDVYVHRIIAKLFIPNPNNYSDVNHINSIVDDNRVDNLEWMTHKDNLEYGFGENGHKARDEFGRFTRK